MTISDGQGYRNSYVGGTGGTTFAFTHNFHQASDLSVFVTNNDDESVAFVYLRSHFEVNPDGGPSGEVRLRTELNTDPDNPVVVLPTADQTLVIQNSPELSQDLNLVQHEALPVESLELILDKIFNVLQVYRARLDAGDTGGDTDIITTSDFDETLLGVNFSRSGDILTIQLTYDGVAVGSPQSTTVAAGVDLSTWNFSLTGNTLSLTDGTNTISQDILTAHNQDANAHQALLNQKADINAGNITNPADVTAWKTALEVPDQAGMGISEADVDTKISDHNTATDAHDNALLDIRGARLADDLTVAEKTAILDKLDAAHEVRLVDRDPRPFTTEMGFADISVVMSGGVTVTTGTRPFFSTRDDIARITTGSSSTSHTGNGSRTVFSFSFTATNANEVGVVVLDGTTNVTSTYPFSVDVSGREVTFTSAIPNGFSVEIFQGLAIAAPKRNLITPPDFITDIMAYQDTSLRWYVLYHKAVDVPQRHVIIIDDDGSGEEAYLIRQTSTDTVTVTLNNGETIEMERYEYEDDNRDWPTSFTIGTNPPTITLSQWIIEGHSLSSENLDAIDYPNETLAFRIVSTTNFRSVSAFYKHPDTSSWERLFVLVGASGDIVDVEDAVAELNREKANRDASNLQSFDKAAWEAYLGLSQYLNNRFTNVPTDPTLISQATVDRLIAILRGPFEQKFLKGTRNPNRQPVFIGRGNTTNPNDTAVLSTSPDIGFAGLVAITRTDSNPANNITRNIRADVLGMDIPVVLTFHTTSGGDPFNYLYYPAEAPDGTAIAGGNDVNNYPDNFTLQQLNDDGSVHLTFNYERASSPAATPNATYNVVTSDHPNGITRNAYYVTFRQTNFATTVPDVGRPFRITNYFLPPADDIGDHPVTFDDAELPAEQANPGDVYRQTLTETSSKISIEDWQKNPTGDGWKEIEYEGGAFDPGELQAELNTLSTNLGFLAGLAESNALNKQNRDWSNTLDRSAVTDANFLRLVNLIFSGLTESQRTIVLNGLFPDNMTDAQKDRALQIFRNLRGIEKTTWWHRLPSTGRRGLTTIRSNHADDDLEGYIGLDNVLSNIDHNNVSDATITVLKTLVGLSGDAVSGSHLFFRGDPNTIGTQGGGLALPSSSVSGDAGVVWSSTNLFTQINHFSSVFSNPPASLRITDNRDGSNVAFGGIYFRESTSIYYLFLPENHFSRTQIQAITFTPDDGTDASAFSRSFANPTDSEIAINGVDEDGEYWQLTRHSGPALDHSKRYSISADQPDGLKIESVNINTVPGTFAPNTTLGFDLDTGALFLAQTTAQITTWIHELNITVRIFDQNPNNFIQYIEVGDELPRAGSRAAGNFADVAFVNRADITSFDGADGRTTNLSNQGISVSIKHNGAEVRSGVLVKYDDNTYRLIVDVQGFSLQASDFPKRFRVYDKFGNHALLTGPGTVESTHILRDGTLRVAEAAAYHRTYGPNLQQDNEYTFEQMASENLGVTIVVGSVVATERSETVEEEGRGYQGQPAIDTASKQFYVGAIDSHSLFYWKRITPVPRFLDSDPRSPLLGAKSYKSSGDNPSYVYLADSYRIDEFDDISWQTPDRQTYTIASGQTYEADRRLQTQDPAWAGLHYFVTYNYNSANNRIEVLLHYNEQERNLTDVTGNVFYDASIDVTFQLDADFSDTSAHFGRFNTDTSTGIIRYLHKRSDGRDIVVNSYEDFLARYRPHLPKELYSPTQAVPEFFSPPENTYPILFPGDTVIYPETSNDYTEVVKKDEDTYVVTGRSNMSYTTKSDQGVSVIERFNTSGTTVTRGFQGRYFNIAAEDFMIFPAAVMGEHFILRGTTYTSGTVLQNQQRVPSGYESNYNIVMTSNDGTARVLPCALIFQRNSGGTTGILRVMLLVAANGVTDEDHALWQLIEELEVIRGSSSRRVPVETREYEADIFQIPSRIPFNIDSDLDGTPEPAIQFSFDVDDTNNDITDLNLQGSVHDLAFNIIISGNGADVDGTLTTLRFDKTSGDTLLERVSRPVNVGEMHYDSSSKIINWGVPNEWVRIPTENTPFHIQSFGTTTTLVSHTSRDYIGDTRVGGTQYFDFDPIVSSSGQYNYLPGSTWRFIRRGDVWIEKIVTQSTTGRWINKKYHGYISGTLLRTNHQVGAVPANFNKWVSQVERDRFKLTTNFGNIDSTNDNDMLDPSNINQDTTFTPQKAFMIIRNIPGYRDVHLENDGDELFVRYDGGKKFTCRIDNYSGERHFAYATGGDALSNQADVVGTMQVVPGKILFHAVSRITNRETTHQIGDLRNRDYTIPCGISLQDSYREFFPENHSSTVNSDRIIMPVGEYTLQAPGSAGRKYYGELYMEYNKWDKIRFFDAKLEDGHLDDPVSSTDPAAQFHNHSQLMMDFSLPYNAVKRTGY